ncbi:hypothetical protein niasHT_018111 [Heterodera trifolii]|uniref:Uncharacterized protein n=1 Tax=Heterodera trifolii TaxID=157864 RepID=A0ABD2LD89_9BILA
MEKLGTETNRLCQLYPDKLGFTQALIQSSELAKDVAGAEALLEQHQEHKGEIEARTDSLKQTAETGQRLLLEEDIDEADEICHDFSSLLQSYLDPTNIHCKLQKHGKCEQELRANRNRLDEIKATGQELIQSGHYANEHIQERIDAIGHQTREFHDTGHFNGPLIGKKFDALRARFETLREPLQRRKQKLAESLLGHQLLRIGMDSREGANRGVDQPWP